MVSESKKTSVRVYPWHDLAWDLALAGGMDPLEIELRSKKNEILDKPRRWLRSNLPDKSKVKHTTEQLRLEVEYEKEAAAIQNDVNTDISTHLWRSILEGNLPVRKANGDPLTGDPKQFKMRGPDTPHLTVAEGNAWLTKNRYLQVWKPGDLKDYRWVDPNVKIPVTGVAAPPHPWNVHDSRDPNPAQPWYTPARHFARQLVKDDSTLLQKRAVLAAKVSNSLKSAGIYKRGGKKLLDSSTILKAFSNVTLS
jgi:hypothetical protein